MTKERIIELATEGSFFLGKFVKTNSGYHVGSSHNNHAQIAQDNAPGEKAISAGWFVVKIRDDDNLVQLNRDWSSTLRLWPDDNDAEGLGKFFGMKFRREGDD